MECIIEVGVMFKVGGVLLLGVGFFYVLIVFDYVMLDMFVVCEEMFGFVVVILCVKSVDEVIELVNVIEFGLGVVIWMVDIE